MTDEGRRRFLAGTGFLAGLAAGCGSRRDPYAPEKPPLPLAKGARPGSESFVASTCRMCDVGCGIRVRVMGGHAVKIEGNPESAPNRGGLCARGLAGLELLYHPERVRGPLRRRGDRRQKSWQAITWDEAIAELGARLGKLRAEGHPEGLLLIDGKSRGNTHALWARFMTAFGSPNHIGHGATGRAAVVETVRAMVGGAAVPSYDFERAACVLLVGTGALEASSQAMPLARSLAGAARPRLFCASARLPRTAALVDEWLPVMPGRAAAFLLGLAHVLVREQLADESAIEKARGFETTRALVMRAYSPKQVEGQTGVSAERIEAIARELVAVRPSVVVVDEETKESGAVAATLLLNALLSSLDAPGGLFLQDEDSASWPAPELDAVAQAGGRAAAIDGRPPQQRGFEASRILAVPDAISSGKPYPAEVLLLHYSNPIFSKPEGGRWASAMAKVPFVVSFSPVLDESVDFADLVLPDPTYLERWDVLPAGHDLLSLQRPVVAPLAGSMQTGQVVLRLAASLGGTVARSLPWKSYREAVSAHLDGRSADGGEAVLDELANNGTYRFASRSRESKKGRTSWPVLDLAPAAMEPAPPVAVDPATFVLVPFRDRGYAEGGFRQFPWLAELGQADGNPWAGYVEMAPLDARSLGIANGDLVAVTSPVARVELQARVRSGIKPGALGLPLGGWGRTVGDLEQMPSRLLAGLADPATGQWLAWGTTARVEKVG